MPMTAERGVVVCSRRRASSLKLGIGGWAFEV